MPYHKCHMLTEISKTGATAKVKILVEQVIMKTLKDINTVISKEMPDSMNLTIFQVFMSKVCRLVFFRKIMAYEQ